MKTRPIEVRRNQRMVAPGPLLWIDFAVLANGTFWALAVRFSTDVEVLPQRLVFGTLLSNRRLWFELFIDDARWYGCLMTTALNGASTVVYQV